MREQILKREDGSKVKIEVRFLQYSSKIEYNVSISVCEKRKRKFMTVKRDDYKYRALDMDERRKAMMNEYLKYVTEDEIYSVCMLLWESLKPSKQNLDT